MADTKLRQGLLKVSYRGLLRYLKCDVTQCYNDVLAIVMERFNIPEEQKTWLQICNENGYVFEKELFEYFILLFPHPEITFYVRLDYKKMPRRETDPTTSTAADTDGRVPFGYSKLNNRRRDGSGSGDDAYGAPVRRQNCFLGALPVTAIARQHQEQEVFRQIAKRRRLNDMKPAAKSQRPVKRSMRI